MPLRATRWSLFIALAVMSVLFWAAAGRASVVIDGVRYHFLDDDQMISMRYARNLAEGQGPVWNAGERVEGYTNFGWMLVMAAVHRAGASDATAAWWVRAINWLLACAVLFLTWRLLETLEVGGLPAAAALVPLALASDLLFWAINGFETTLLTAVFLWSLLRALHDVDRGHARWGTFLLAGLLPVIRADAVDLTAGVVLVALVLGPRMAWWRAGAALVPLACHEVFRLSYYGDWLPNTFYLKVAGRSGLALAGAGNLKGFGATYAAAIMLAFAAALMARDRRVRVLALLPLAGMCRMLLTGPDMFLGFRFLAPYLPLILVLAAAAIVHLAPPASAARRAFAALLAVVTVAGAGVDGRTRFGDLVSPNGLPAINAVTGVLIARHTRPDARIAVTAAGAISYFSRRPAIDLLGKSDRHVARLPPQALGPTGHNRYDIEWSLGMRPDVVATFARHAYAAEAARAAADPAYERAREGYGGALVLSSTFIALYRDHPVPVPFLLARNALYIRADSPEIAGLAGWREPKVALP